ncbi:M48 family metallopeptidase [Endozoicomonas sp. SM1973]|uniref:M48 family metallopeptidase n=1 Tax=Spartinivicinus marinus TaxID=2994442 RepID=A0A853ICC3_9GAMM|nr:M48 family metallopeptidase [Spartinivicinus marinus]MCX4028500.1 M48 family metallopeptidase [Spartinivicinus marinus]NYZ67167.1 M48 family metallopeptidase [Spartinivicinus marinus]
MINTQSSYTAHAFYKDLPNGRCSGTLSIGKGKVLFAGGGHELSIPIEGSQFKLGGASNRLVFISHPDQPEFTCYTNDLGILKNPLLTDQPAIAAQFTSAKRKRTKNNLIFTTVALLILASPFSLYFAMGPIAALLARQVPVSWEQALGEQAIKQYQLSSTFMPDKQVQALLPPLTKPLVDAIPSNSYEFHFYVVKDEDVNAFALPGGYIVIHSGLILKADSAEELLGVVAHEIAHVTEQHGLRNIISATGTFIIVDALLGDMSGLLAVLADAAPLLINQSYSRQFESDADEQGVVLLKTANINPQGLHQFFKKIQEEETKRLAQIADEDSHEVVQQSLALLSSHPATSDRISQLKLLTQQNDHSYRNLNQEFQQLKQAVQQFVTHTSSDPTTDEN